MPAGAPARVGVCWVPAASSGVAQLQAVATSQPPESPSSRRGLAPMARRDRKSVAAGSQSKASASLLWRGCKARQPHAIGVHISDHVTTGHEVINDFGAITANK